MHDRKLDWSEWHRDYDDPSSALSRRLRVVQEYLRRAIDDRPGPIRIISMCAGQGRDVIDVLADHPRRDEIAARLVELDPRNAAVAEAAARQAGLEHVGIVKADAALTDSYAGAVPADVILTCGVFGNITDRDVRRTIEHLPHLSAPGATVIWTRGQEPTAMSRQRSGGGSPRAVSRKSPSKRPKANGSGSVRTAWSRPRVRPSQASASSASFVEPGAAPYAASM